MRGRFFIGAILLIGAVLAWNYLRSWPVIAATTAVPAQSAVPGDPVALPWPSVGSAAVAVSGLGALGSTGNAPATPTASVAKVMTALVILTDKPIKAGETGPTLTVTDADVQTYLSDREQQQSVVAVSAGEQLTEFQALEGMLIPSGNNMAETLARWDAGSITSFVDKMNKRAKALGLKTTKFADPAGASTESVSTPTELITLGIAAMQQAAFAQIVVMTQAELPVAGVVYNVDSVLGQAGIIGIKTGSGLKEGANFLFAAAIMIGPHPVTMYGCVMGQPTLAAAFNAAKALVIAMKAGLTVKKVLIKNQTVGAYDTTWGQRADVIATTDVDLVEWPGMILRQRLDAPVLKIDGPLPAGTRAGTLHVVLGAYVLDVPVVTDTALYPPGKFWRVTRLPWSNS